MSFRLQKQNNQSRHSSDNEIDFLPSVRAQQSFATSSIPKKNLKSIPQCRKFFFRLLFFCFASFSSMFMISMAFKKPLAKRIRLRPVETMPKEQYYMEIARANGNRNPETENLIAIKELNV